jgi:hypothetical protein
MGEPKKIRPLKLAAWDRTPKMDSKVIFKK